MRVIYGNGRTVLRNELEVFMMSLKLKASLREDLRSSATKELRNSGLVPAVVYGKGEEAKAVSVDSIELVKLIRDQGRNAIFSLDIEGGKPLQVMLHDYQAHALRDHLVHVDFFKVNLTEEMDVQVPVQLDGEPEGAREGGILQQSLYELQVRAMPNDIPEEISIDISALNIGDSISVEDLPKADLYTVLDEPDATIASVLPPALEEEEEEAPEAGTAEPELVDAESEENEEG